MTCLQFLFVEKSLMIRTNEMTNNSRMALIHPIVNQIPYLTYGCFEHNCNGQISVDIIHRH
jgi:hypothetical protein